MAFKFALLAALCVAQAFAFPSSSEGLLDEVNKAVSSNDLRIVIGCFRNQQFNVIQMTEKISKVAQTIVDGVDDNIKESVKEHLKQTEEPVARIDVALSETHRTMYVYLNKLDVPKAFEALITGVRTIEGIMTEISTALNNVKVEEPNLSHAMDWYMRSLSFAMEVMIPKIRRDYGQCLVAGYPIHFD